MRIVKYISFLSLLLLTASCSDHLFEDLIITNEEDSDGMSFTVSTVEMADQIVNMGGTRANRSENSEGTVCSDAFVSHPLTGDASYGLQVHRMPLPYVGIHRKAVNVPCVEPSESANHSTRAPAAAIVDADATNFHDSLSIWGYTNAVYKDTGEGVEANKTIFKQTLLKKVNNWRSSAHWPYGTDSDTKMRFYAIAPAVENLDVQMTGSEPNFTTSPTFTYTLPETAGEMRDLLYGESAEIAVQPGPTGSNNGDPKAENLGKDNKLVGLTFQHILTCIRFAKGTIPNGITIQQIAIEGVGTSATFTPSATDASTATSGAWSASSGSATYTLWPQGVTSTSGSNVYIDGDSCFFMIPQTLSSSAKLTVTLIAPQHYEVDDNGVYTPNDGKRTSASSGSSRTHTLSCSLSGDIWKKGYTVTYKLTVGEVEDGYYLIAENPEAHEHSNASINGAFPVHSYRSYFDYSDPAYPDGKEVKTHAVNWKVVGYSTTKPTAETNFTTANKPDWLGTAGVYGTTSGTSYAGGYGATANYIVNAQVYAPKGNHQTNLVNNSESQSWPTIDLSTNGTANSYVINHRGSFNFPLVYGNKTADGTEESCFVDHQGTVISYYKIKDQIKAKNPPEDVYEDIVENVTRKRTEYTWETTGSNPTLRSMVVWQDVEGLIIPSITSDYISFSANKSMPGNAVIALQGRTRTTYQKKYSEDWVLDTDQGAGGYDYGLWETFWTWHIWMTDEVYANYYNSSSEVKVNEQYLNWNGTDHLVSLQNKANNEEYKILPVNLGWVADRSTFLVDAVEYDFGFYDHREVWVKLEQEEPDIEGVSKQSTIVKIEQHARQPRVTGTSTVYQWGRPTAFPSVLNIRNERRTIYDGAGNDITDQFQIAVPTNAGDAISQPLQILRYSNSEGGDGAWFDVNAANHAYWSANTKTVYDPCPPGFRMPSSTVFTGMSRTGTREANGTSLNIYPEVDGQVSAENRKGGYFYTIRYTNDDNLNTNRYTVSDTEQSTLFYMPATGEYQGDLSVGTAMSSSSSYTHVNTASGIYWMGDHTQDYSKMGTALWFYPSWNYTGSDTDGERAIDFGRTVKYSSLLPIRPVQQ